MEREPREPLAVWTSDSGPGLAEPAPVFQRPPGASCARASEQPCGGQDIGRRDDKPAGNLVGKGPGLCPVPLPGPVPGLRTALDVCLRTQLSAGREFVPFTDFCRAKLRSNILAFLRIFKCTARRHSARSRSREPSLLSAFRTFCRKVAPNSGLWKLAWRKLWVLARGHGSCGKPLPDIHQPGHHADCFLLASPTMFTFSKSRGTLHSRHSRRKRSTHGKLRAQRRRERSPAPKCSSVCYLVGGRKASALLLTLVTSVSRAPSPGFLGILAGTHVREFSRGEAGLYAGAGVGALVCTWPLWQGVG